jgi:Mrp family chromosome partitioning ATPase/capsular polysaccharide biosynthesis protein
MTEPVAQQDELDLRSYVRPVWRRKWIVIVIVIAAAGGTYFLSARQPKVYTTSTAMFVSDANPAADILNPALSAIAPSGVALANVAQLLTAASVQAAVDKQIGPAAAGGSVAATASTTSSFVTVTGTSSNPALAAQLANTYVSVFISSRRQQVRQVAAQQLNGYQKALAALPSGKAGTSVFSERQTLQQTADSYRAADLNPDAGARQVNTAGIPSTPISPTPKRDAIFGGVVGLVLAIIAAFCLELLDRRLTSVSSIESAYRRPVLAVLPHVGNPTPSLAGKRPVVPAAFLEELRSLTVMLRLGGRERTATRGTAEEGGRTVIITSTLPREGKSTVTRDLALIYAEAGQKTLVIDGDLRQPSMKRLFDVSGEHGLVDVLRDEVPLAEAVVTITGLPAGDASGRHGPTDASENGNSPEERHSTLDVLTHGERLSSPLALLSSDRMRELLEEASAEYDVILIDTPPALAIADTVPLLRDVDQVLVVARLGQTTRTAAGRLREIIERIEGVNFIGVVANDRREDTEERYGTYGRYGYDYRGAAQSQSDESSKRQKAPKHSNGSAPETAPDHARQDTAAPDQYATIQDAVKHGSVEALANLLDDAEANNADEQGGGGRRRRRAARKSKREAAATDADEQEEAVGDESQSLT